MHCSPASSATSARKGAASSRSFLRRRRRRRQDFRDAPGGARPARSGLRCRRRPGRNARPQGNHGHARRPRAILPKRSVEYRGAVVHEFDIDAALARKPRLIIVDELAHSNAAGSRHPKRWHDIAGTARRGHRRLFDGQRPAPGKPQRRGGPDHRRARLGDDSRQGVRRGRRRWSSSTCRRTSSSSASPQARCTCRSRPSARHRISSARAT